MDDNERARSKYYERKRKGVCVYCGKTDENTANGRIACAKCREMRYARSRKYTRTEKGRRKRRNNKRKIAHERYSKGLCVNCGKNTPEEDKLCCTSCLAKARDNYYKQKEKKDGK